MSWLVTFTLTEFLSVAEKKEAAATSRATSKAQGAGAGTGGSGAASAGESDEKMTWFERKVLKPVNDALE